MSLLIARKVDMFCGIWVSMLENVKVLSVDNIPTVDLIIANNSAKKIRRGLSSISASTGAGIGCCVFSDIETIRNAVTGKEKI